MSSKMASVIRLIAVSGAVGRVAADGVAALRWGGAKGCGGDRGLAGRRRATSVALTLAA
jgi:hypothetical protein